MRSEPATCPNSWCSPSSGTFTADKLPDFIMEAGGRQYEALTRIAKAQMRYPDILSSTGSFLGGAIHR